MQYFTKFCWARCILFPRVGSSNAQISPYAADPATPIGLEVDDQGRLWVAEAGTGNGPFTLRLRGQSGS